MLDIKFIRENKKEVAKGVKAKGFDIDINLILDFDEQNRRLEKEIENLNIERKKAAKVLWENRLQKSVESRFFWQGLNHQIL